MNLLLYYFLRKIFVRLDFTEKYIYLRKGVILRRFSVIPLSGIVRVTSERSLIMRIFGAKKIIVFTIRGKVTFYLRKSEKLPFLPEIRSVSIKPRFSEVMFGAFADTRALGGIALLAAFLRRLSSLFGGEYFDRVMSAISETAETLSNALSVLHIAVPRMAALLAVFVLAAWSLAFARKLLRLAKLRAARHGGILRVQSGVITLYDHTLVLNSAAVSVSPLSAMLAKRAPLYLRGVMIYPAVSKARSAKMIRVLCGILIDRAPQLKPPKSSFFGFCAAPFWWSIGFSAALALVYISDSLRSAMLLKTALYCGLIVSLYAVAVSLVCMSRSGLTVGEHTVKLSMRRGLRLFAYSVPHRTIVEETFSQSIFQRRSGLCHIRLATAERSRLTARQLIKSEIPRYTPF
ncbi:MAG: PH domain-containing protein [Ruminococcaceae bacterium]|nr:PH domain-containing protein [Oscillospiraceae bacterium]